MVSIHGVRMNNLIYVYLGQDTTASAMTWMVKYLDENQGVLEVLLVININLLYAITENV